VCSNQCLQGLRNDVKSCAKGTASAAVGLFVGCVLATGNVPGCAEATGLYAAVGASGCLVTVAAKAIACLKRCPQAPAGPAACGL